MRYANAYEVYAKADWEGGIFDLITEYGVTSDQLPESFPQYVIDAWNRVYAAGQDVFLIEEYLQAHLYDNEEEE